MVTLYPNNPLQWAILASILLPQVFAKLVNVTVDDAGVDSSTNGMISYTGWNFGPECHPCLAHLDGNKVHNHTWHDTTYNPSVPYESTPQNATFEFTG